MTNTNYQGAIERIRKTNTVSGLRDVDNFNNIGDCHMNKSIVKLARKLAIRGATKRGSILPTVERLSK